MFNFLSKNLRGNHLKKALRYRLMSYKNENVIGGGLEKPQGGLREEKYFSEQNNILMLQIRDHGTNFKKESSVGNFNQEISDTCNGHTSLRDSCSINKQKNCLEEAFFLNEQKECCARLRKHDDFKAVEIKTETNMEIE